MIRFGGSDLVEAPASIFISGLEEGDRFGRSVSFASDVNGDGIDDVIVGSSPRSDVGEGSADVFVIVVTSELNAVPFDLADLDGSNGFVIKTDETASFNSVYGETAGDLNGDGIDDIVVAHYRDNGESANHVILGTAYGFDASLDIATLDGTNGFTLPTISSSDLARSATSAGDVNGDGIDDLLIGAYGASANGSGNGETYILFGSTDGFDATFDLSTLDGTNGYVLHGSG